MTIVDKDSVELDKIREKKRILEITNLKTYFYTEEGVVKAVDGVSLDMYEDETLGLVGETGCGKSVTALSIIGLVRAPGEIIDGKILFRNKNLREVPPKTMRNYRGDEITMIFQDPLNSLNPVLKVGDQIGEVFMLHQKDEMGEIKDRQTLERKQKLQEIKDLKENLDISSEDEKKKIIKRINQLKTETKEIPSLKKIVKKKSIKIIQEVGIADAEGILDRYPHELSGGMRQRVMIAMALSCNPALLIADEPTTALDVTIQAQILDLMKILKDKFRTSILLITHDLGIIAEMCDRVAVMYSGNIVEYAKVEELFKNPHHPYTKGLIGAIPSIEKRDQKLQIIRGMVPNLIYPPSGCRFHPRCDERLEICDKVKPRFLEIKDRYFIACHLYDQKYKDSPKYDWNKENMDDIANI